MARCYDAHLDRLAWHPLPDDADAMDDTPTEVEMSEFKGTAGPRECGWRTSDA